MKYEIFKSITTDNYIAIIYFDGFETANKIRKEIENKGFIITDDDYDGKTIVLWLEKKKK